MQFIPPFIYILLTSYQSMALKLYVSNSISLGSQEGCQGSLITPFKKISEALSCISENMESIKQENSLEILLHENDEENPYIINNKDFNHKEKNSPFAQLSSKGKYIYI